MSKLPAFDPISIAVMGFGVLLLTALGFGPLTVLAIVTRQSHLGRVRQHCVGRTP